MNMIRNGHGGSDQSAGHRRGGVLLMGVVGLALLAFGGCSTPIFSPDEPYSQYDRNDALRGKRAPSYIYDQYGTRRPNIRQRLLGVAE